MYGFIESGPFLLRFDGPYLNRYMAPFCSGVDSYRAKPGTAGGEVEMKSEFDLTTARSSLEVQSYIQVKRIETVPRMLIQVPRLKNEDGQLHFHFLLFKAAIYAAISSLSPPGRIFSCMLILKSVRTFHRKTRPSRQLLSRKIWALRIIFGPVASGGHKTNFPV